MYRKSVFIIILTVFVMALAACNSSGSDPAPAEVDLSGIWKMTQVVDGNCSGSTYPKTEFVMYSATQSGNDATFVNTLTNETMTGTVSGLTLTGYQTIDRASGTLTISSRVTSSADGQTVSGSATWTYSQPGYDCNGTSTITGIKASTTQVDATGTWSGTYVENETGISGSFSAAVTDTNGTLTGTINADLLPASSALTGSVVGNAITFGDINNDVTFAGLIDGNNAEGAFLYYSMEGNWGATRP